MHNRLHILGGKLDHHQNGVHVLVCNQHSCVLAPELFNVGRPAIQAVVIAEHSGAAAWFLGTGFALHGDEIGRRIGVLSNSTIRVNVCRARKKSRNRVSRNSLDLVVAINPVEVVEQWGLDVDELCRVVGSVARFPLVCGYVKSTVCVAVAITTSPARKRINRIKVVYHRLRAGTDVCHHAHTIIDSLTGAGACVFAPAYTVNFDVLLLFQCRNSAIQTFKLFFRGETGRVDCDLDLRNAVNYRVEVVSRHIGNSRTLRPNPLWVVGKTSVGIKDFFPVGVLGEYADFFDEKTDRHANAGNGNDNFGLSVFGVVDTLKIGVFELMYEPVQRRRIAGRRSVAHSNAGDFQRPL